MRDQLTSLRNSDQFTGLGKHKRVKTAKVRPANNNNMYIENENIAPEVKRKLMESLDA